MYQAKGGVSDYIFLIGIKSQVDLAMSVCPYECRDLSNYKS